MSTTLHQHTAEVLWERRAGERHVDGRYSRAHQWRFDGGATVAASSSPLVVPVPLSDEGAVDPEEAFVAALASCHMLFFLQGAAEQGFVLERYQDDAIGVMGEAEDGRIAMLRVTLRPKTAWSGRRPNAEEVAQIHARSHHNCYLANSVKTEVVVEPVPDESETNG